MLKDYLNAFYDAIFVYAIIRLIFVNGENIDSRKSGTLMPTLINCWDKFSCCKKLNIFIMGLNSRRKGFKNWWNWT